MFKTILVPLDGSPFSEMAIPPALSLSRRCGASVHLANVREAVPTLATGEWEPAAELWSTTYLGDVQRRVREATDQEVTTEVLEGEPAAALDSHSFAIGADLVIMSTHGRGAASRFWLGSVADAVLRHVQEPILMVRPGENGEDLDLAADVDVNRILVTLDGSNASEAILWPSARLARAWDAPVTVLRIVPYPDEIASAYLPHTVQMNLDALEEGRKSASLYVDDIVQQLREQGVEAEGKVEVDTSPSAGILRQVSVTGAGAVALATHGYGGIRRVLLGSVADKVVRGTEGMALLVRPTDD
jgi:nucleotide-binding universal stress UspA family protein